MNTTNTPSPFTDAFTANADEFYSQLYISVPIGFILIFLYCIIRKLCINNFEVRRHESQYLLSDDDDDDDNAINYPQISSTTFIKWIYDIWNMDSFTFYQYAGYDALIFRLFLLSSVNICLLSMPYAIIILLPVYGTSQSIDSSNDDWLDRLSLNTVSINSNRLYATLIGAYFFSFIVLYYLFNIYLKIAYLTEKYLIASKDIKNIDQLTWFNYNKVMMHNNNIDNIGSINSNDIDLNEEEEKKYDKLPIDIYDDDIIIPSIDKYTAMITNLPSHLRDEQIFTQFMEQLFPHKILKIVIIPNVTELIKINKQIKYHQNKLEKLCKTHNFNIDDIYKESNLPQIYGRINCYGFCGKRVDLILYHRTNKDKLITKFNRLQDSKLELTGTAFITFNTLCDVSSFISSPKCLDLLMVEIELAPDPNQIYWENLKFTQKDLIKNNLCILILMILLLIFWSIPVIAIQSLANLDIIFKTFGGDINNYLSTSTISWLQGSLSVLILDLWLILVPIIVGYFSLIQKPSSKSKYKLLMINKYYICLIFMVLLVTVITSTILSGANNYKDYFKNFVNNMGNIANLLANGLSNMSIYFLLYILLNTFIWLPLELYQPGFQLYRHGKDKKKQIEFMYDIWIPKILLIFTILLTYSVMNPIMYIFGLIYFVFATIIFTYNLSMSYYQTFIIGPKLWILIFNLIRYSFIISIVTLYGLLLLKQNYICSVLLIPLLIFIWVITSKIKIKFDKIFNSAPLISAKNKDRKLIKKQIKNKKEKIDNLYMPPVLCVKYEKKDSYYQLQQ